MLLSGIQCKHPQLARSLEEWGIHLLMSNRVNSLARVLGIRVEPSSINWAIVEGTRELPILVAADDANAPAQWDEANALSWYRERVLHIIEQYNPAIVAVRYQEPKGRAAGNAGRKRARIEGIVLEASNSRAIPVKTGALVTISANLKTKSAKIYLSRDDLRGLDWSKQNPLRREAILVAVSVLVEE